MNTNTETETTTEMTYQERLAKLASLNIHTHEVRVASDLLKVNLKFKFFNEDDAREHAHALVAAARMLHGETVERGRYVDSYSGVADLYSYEDVFHNYESEVFRKGWSVTVYCMFPQDKYNENEIAYPANPEFVFGHRFGANRLADPGSKVFICFSGMDCDRSGWSRVSEYRDLREAADDVDRAYEWADGPMSYSVITREQFEQYGG